MHPLKIHRVRLLGAAALVLSGLLAANPARVAYAAAITVTTTTDELDTNGACSLREAIRAANTNKPVGACAAGSATSLDTITLPTGTYVLTRTGADENDAVTGDLDVTGGSLKIVGANTDTTIIDGNALDRVLNVRGGATLTLANATIQNGKLGYGVSTSINGGGIYNGGTLTLERVVVSGNHGATLGGGVYNESTLTVNASTITGNTTEYPGSGGGIYNDRKLTLNNSTVVQNSANDGAGIYNNGMATLGSTTVHGNVADLNGGGIYNAASRSLTINRSTISDNYAMTRGGGVYGEGTTTISFSTVKDNGAQHDTGGIFNGSTGVLQITNSTISGNSVYDGGGAGGIRNGGAATITNTTISGNRSWDDDGTDGGGIENGGTLALRNSTITQNEGTIGGLKSSGSTTLANTLIAGNIGHDWDNGGLEPSPDCWGTITSQGYNLIGSTQNCTITGDATGNILNVAPNLGPLQNNGGPTLTHALDRGSPAIDAGNPAASGSSATACPAKDQRDVARPKDGNNDGAGRCDIGAVERKSATTP